MFLKSLIIRFTCEKKAESYKIVCFSFNISKLGCGSATMTILVYIYIYTHTHTYIYIERLRKVQTYENVTLIAQQRDQSTIQ